MCTDVPSAFEGRQRIQCGQTTVFWLEVDGKVAWSQVEEICVRLWNFPTVFEKVVAMAAQYGSHVKK